MALRAVIDAPDLELVGVRVYGPDKVGTDAGELAGRPPTGIRATDSKADVLALDPDVVLYMARVENNVAACVGDAVDLLAAGADVIATGSPFIDAQSLGPEHHQALTAACEKGGSSFLGLGLFPGFWGEAVAPVLSRLAFGCDRISVREHLSYAAYPSTQLIFDVMGYGQAPDSTTAALSDPSRAAGVFTSTARILAKALGLDLRSVRPVREVAVTDTELTVAAGTIPAGTVGAMRLGVLADCGPVSIAVEHVTWMAPRIRPEWSAPGEGYQIELDGTPSLRCTLVLGTKGEDHSEMGCLATAMHAVHAIPAVRAAATGVLDLADVTNFVGRLA
ncbi:dihydrodipicolinate reductase [Frankia sp. AgB1.9]|nr:dihydrodipicolinate reductase [Frankia sp. AgW1.1]MBL7551873.1 dihydrodipicolinate reductase [Frankia sp. AgB1.9]